jgi:hypothetical protein
MGVLRTLILALLIWGTLVPEITKSSKSFYNNHRLHAQMIPGGDKIFAIVVRMLGTAPAQLELFGGGP